MYKPRFKVVFSNERILSPSGLGIVGGMLAKSVCDGAWAKQHMAICIYENLAAFCDRIDSTTE